jgi:hypothetical protein
MGGVDSPRETLRDRYPNPRGRYEGEDWGDDDEWF